jgi:hypothetical protein
MSKSERIAAHIESLERIAKAAEAEGRYNEAISATSHVLNRLEGLPVARNINMDGNTLGALSDAELRDELARLDRAAAALTPGDAPASLSHGPADVVH